MAIITGEKCTREAPKHGHLIPPTDFDSPVPVQFLSIRGAAHFVLTCDDPSANGRKWLDFARDLLITSLGDWGVGGKTSSGYGRLVPLSQQQREPPKPPSPKYKRGDRPKVKYVKDAKGRLKFQADDSFLGHIASGPAPTCQEGESVELLGGERQSAGLYLHHGGAAIEEEMNGKPQGRCLAGLLYRNDRASF